MSDDLYKSFFYNTENLDSIYNILKGNEQKLTRLHVKKLIQDYEGVEYEGKFKEY